MSRKIAFFIQDLRAGGAERSVVRLANGIAARGVSVDLVLLRKTGPFVAEVSPEVRMIDLDCHRTLQSVIALKSYMQRAKPDALISHMTHTNVAAIMARMLSSFKSRLIVVEHNQFLKNLALKNGLVRLAYRLVPWLYRRADKVAVVAEDMRKEISQVSRLPESAIEVLYNPVITPELSSLAAAQPDHPWFEEDIPVILAAARFSRQKNFPLLIEAFSLVRRKHPARLMILGEGDLRPSLEQQIKTLGLEKDVDLPGFRANPFAFMKRSSVFALSSDWEGLPTVLIEAMACGCNVVATDCPTGPREILQDGQYGALVAVGDPEAFAKALEQALMSQASSSSRQQRAALYNVENAVEAYIRVAFPEAA